MNSGRLDYPWTLAAVLANGRVPTTAGEALGSTSLDFILYARSLTTIAGQSFTGTATAPTQITTAQTGVGFSFTASNAVAGSSVAGAAAGGAVTVTTGNAARLTSGDAAGGDYTINLGTGIGSGRAGQLALRVSGAGINLRPTSSTLTIQDATGAALAALISLSSTASTFETTSLRAALLDSSPGSLALASGGFAAWSSTSSYGGSKDISLYRHAAGILALGSGAASGGGVLAFPLVATPTLSATACMAYGLTSTLDLVLAGGTGGTGGVRIIDPDAPGTDYIRIYHDGSNAYIESTGASYVRVGPAGNTAYITGGEIAEFNPGSGLINFAQLAMIESPSPAPTIANFGVLHCRDQSGTTAALIQFPTNLVRIAKDLAAVALTQTYSTTTATHAAMTSADLAAFTGGVVGFLDEAERDAIRTQVNALRADIINLKGFVNTIADALQAQTSYVS